MDTISLVALAVVLAACAGLRAFLPVFSTSLAAQVLPLPLPDALGWLDRPSTLVLFGAATLLEILGDKIPVVDHFLDAIQVVTKPVLAAVAAAPFIFQLAPEYTAAIAIIMGAPLALGVHATKATVRVGSTATTAGMANPLLSVGEDILAVVSIVLAFLLPVLALVLLAGFLFVLVRLALRARRGLRRPSA